MKNKYKFKIYFFTFFLTFLLVLTNNCSPRGGKNPYAIDIDEETTTVESEETIQHLSLESQVDGSGESLVSISIGLNSQTTIYSLLRIENDNSFSAVPATWSVEKFDGNIQAQVHTGSEFVFNTSTTGLYYIIADYINHQKSVMIFVTNPDDPVFNYDMQITLEDQPNGQGQEVRTSEILEETSTQPFYFTLRRADTKEFLAQLQGEWQLQGGLLGELSFNAADRSYTYYAPVRGSGSIVFRYGTLTTYFTLTITPPVLEEKAFWLDIFAQGPKTNVQGLYVKPDNTTSSNLSESDMKVNIKWNTLSDVNTESWEVFKSDTLTGFNYNSPYAVISDPNITNFEDTNLSPGQSYFYNVLPREGGLLITTHEKIFPIEVIVPQNNLAFIHRAIANKLTCERLHFNNANTIDIQNFNRCNYTGPAQKNGFFDLGHHLIVDRFELGCNTSLPNVTFSAGIGCALNGLYSRNMNESQILSISSPASQLPPLLFNSQDRAYKVCQIRSTSLNRSGQNFTFPFRLMDMVEWRVATAWPDNLTNTEIAQLESSNSTKSCNTRFAANANQSERVGDQIYAYLITGSNSTSNCVSRFGMQDLIGNASEWISDRCNWSRDPVYDQGYCGATSSEIRPSALTGMTIFRHGLEPPYFEPAVGMPVMDQTDGAVHFRIAKEYVNADKADAIHLDLKTPSMGGSYGNGGRAGRWSSYNYHFINSPYGVGFRCASEVPSME